jgi:large subunit ribosomal protein L9
MKVVLQKDVRNMGLAGSVINVADGHALNFLIPRKLAVLATPAAMKKAEEVSKAAGERKDIDANLISDRLTALAEEKVVIRKKANEQGHLYDGVDAKDIAAAAHLPVDAIHIDKPFKEIGTFDVPVAKGADFGKISITIEAE